MEPTWNPLFFFFPLSDPFLQEPSMLADRVPPPSGVKPVCVGGAHRAGCSPVLCDCPSPHSVRCLGAQEIDKPLVSLVGNLPTSFVPLRKENVLSKVW